jgi:hypothetical protein
LEKELEASRLRGVEEELEALKEKSLPDEEKAEED